MPKWIMTFDLHPHEHAGDALKTITEGTLEEVCTALRVTRTLSREQLEVLLQRRGMGLLTEVYDDGGRNHIVYGRTGSESRVGWHRADRLLNRIEAWTPLKLREELLGDIREDVEYRREQGWPEKKIRRLIWWQFGYAIAGWLWGRAERVLALIRPVGK
jgi:hypothetical protein